MQSPKLTDIIGDFPYRVTLAGGWIDQPFCSRLNPTPPGSVCLVNIEPDFVCLERAGLATGTRHMALKLWGGVPEGDLQARIEELYAVENQGAAEPSGSQDMIGLLTPGISRLDYDFAHRGGIFPRHIENTCDAGVAAWLESVLNVLPMAPRPPGYNPLEVKRLEAVDFIVRLGRSGQEAYDAILARDVRRLGEALNETSTAWEKLLPGIFTHHTLTLDLLAILKYYQAHYPGACFSGCGGGYLFVPSEKPVPGAFRIKVRLS